jgi:hypothetical protein
MWRAIALALVGYWFGEREGERRAHEGRFRTPPNGRCVYDDTAPGWSAAPRRDPQHPRSIPQLCRRTAAPLRGLVFIAAVAFGLWALGAAHLSVNAFLILSGLFGLFAGMALLGFWRSCATLVFGGMLLAHAKADPPLDWAQERTYCAIVRDTGELTQFKQFDRSLHQNWLWRCLAVDLFVCPVGADGVACSRRTAIKVPMLTMMKECSQGRVGSPSVASGAYAYKWRWECRDNLPVIVGTAVEIDAYGFAPSEWREIK